RGVPASDQFVAWYMKGDQVLAADCINSPKEFMAAKKIISQKIVLPESALADASVDLNSVMPKAE
ncbi:oxidoreductase C-terminal domain-containing protein, partial [Arthrospira platensis SPKY1]|nr:oxidoreductase C-terminal domain-containing protein [Arthrospira platensis SPKY1]